MTKMNVSQAVVEILRQEEVEYVFGVPGSCEIPFLDALEDCPEIKYILTLHEANAVGMAEGYARATGKVGVLNLHTVAGLGAAMPLLLNAHAGMVPLVIIGGQQVSTMLMQEPQLSADLKAISSHFTNWSTEITYASDTALVLRRAFKVAAGSPAGPVYISIPKDIQSQGFHLEYTPTKETFIGQRTNSEAINKAAELLAEAQSPVILLGSGVSSHNAVEEVVKLAELTGASVYQQWMADMDFPTSHPQYVEDICVWPGPDIKDIVKSIDLLLVIGTKMFKFAPYITPTPFPSHLKMIHIDDNPWEIGKNFPVDISIEGDIKTCVSDLYNALGREMKTEVGQDVAARVKEISIQKEEKKESLLEKARKERDKVPISVSRLMTDLGESISPGTIIVEESWSCGSTMQEYINFDEPRSFFRMRGGGSIGWGIPAALGVKLAFPERQVIAVVGDGGAIFSIQGLWIAARYNLPVTFVICSNGSYGTLKTVKMMTMGEEVKNRVLGMDMDKPRLDFVQLAQSMGVMGQRVQKPEELKDAFKAAIESNKPTLVDVLIEDTI